MQWYLAIDGKRQGPFDDEQARQLAQSHPEAKCWREGWPDWVPVKSVDRLYDQTESAPPPMVVEPAGPPSLADEIDYIIYGDEMQFVEIELDPEESAVAEAGAMMYKDASITMKTIFGDGSQKSQSGSMFDKFLGAGKRLITGEGIFTTMFTHEGSGKARVAFAAPFPGKILPLSLNHYNGRLICQKDSFLCGARGVSLGIHFQKKILTGLFGGEGFIMQKLEGDGLVFIHAGGTLKAIELAAEQVMHVDTGCLVALTETIDYDVEQVGGVLNMFAGGEGLFYARLKGPGTVWLQSLPFSRLAGRMLSAGKHETDRGEGSVLGGLGRLLDGDNRW